MQGSKRQCKGGRCKALQNKRSHRATLPSRVGSRATLLGCVSGLIRRTLNLKKTQPMRLAKNFVVSLRGLALLLQFAVQLAERHVSARRARGATQGQAREQERRMSTSAHMPTPAHAHSRRQLASPTQFGSPFLALPFARSRVCRARRVLAHQQLCAVTIDLDLHWAGKVAIVLVPAVKRAHTQRPVDGGADHRAHKTLAFGDAARGPLQNRKRKTAHKTQNYWARVSA